MAAPSKTFKDVNLSFRRHPVTNDILTLRNEDAIKRSVHNIVLTITGEKPFLNDFGTVINASLFELDTGLEYVGLENQIISSLQRYEPRIDIDKVNVVIDGDNNSMSARVQYSIIGISAPSQQIDVLLFPARV